MTRLDREKDVYVELVDFGDTPGSEVVTENDDGSYTILLNARYSYERQVEACRHACRHIEGNDFEKTEVQEIEKDCHDYYDDVRGLRHTVGM